MIKPYERVDLKKVDPDAIRKLADLLSTKHRLDGGVVLDELPFLGFRLSPDLAEQFGNAQIPHFRVFPYICLGTLGGSLGFKARFKEAEQLAHVCVNRKDAVFQSLRTGKITALFFQNRQPIYAFQLDCSHEHANYSSWWEQVANHEPVIDDGPGHFWEVLMSFNEQVRSDFAFSKKDKLAGGWVHLYQGQVNDLDNQIKNLQDLTTFAELFGDEVPHLLTDLLLAIRDSRHRLAPVYRFVQDHVGLDDKKLLDLYEAGAIFQEEHMKDVRDFVRELIETYLISSSQTDCGQCVRWFDSVNARLDRFPVNVGKFPDGFAPEHYWKRLLWELPCNWGYILKASDVPISPRQVAQHASELPRADDTAEVDSTADLLLDEALADKRFTIPAGAVVDFPFGPFATIQVHELNAAVVFKFQNVSGEFYIATVFPKQHACTFKFPITDQNVDKETMEAIGKGVKLFLAAVIRDFWVMEEREAVFGCRRIGGVLPGDSKCDEEGPRIVYIPRIKYTPKANRAACEESLGHRERRMHFVAAHIRRAEHASPAQLILAERHGRQIPPGHTFVRPHERGRGVRAVMYRSRSALRSLYSVAPPAAFAHESDWFQFERDVHALMAALGFTVEHISASRRGDGGVDLYATKGQDLDLVNWVIQCKCFDPRNKVGPGIVRELAGIIGRYPAGTRGMIVTTSSFTPKGMEEAQRTEIRLMDGVEFLKLRSAQYSGGANKRGHSRH